MIKKEKSLLLISKVQFGYFVDQYQWCVNLKDEYDITVLSQFENKAYIQLDGIKVIYIPFGNQIKTRKLFLKQFSFLLSNFSFDSILISYYKLCFLIRLFFPFKTAKAILDIRTLDINESNIKRLFNNTLLRFETVFFYKISIISEIIQKKIILPKSKCFIVPLGANQIKLTKVSTTNISLIYIGTFHLRRIEDTIAGFKIYVDNYWNQQKNPIIEYNIIGTGNKDDEDLINKIILKNHLNNQVKVLGYIPNQELFTHLTKASIGISYIPINDYFNLQPPTKTYEYLAAGMPIIATKTFANKQIVNEINGVLIEDNPNSFSLGLKIIIDNYSNYNSDLIQKSVINNTWEIISKVLSRNI